MTERIINEGELPIPKIMGEEVEELVKRLRAIAESTDAKAILLVRFNEPTGEPNWTPFKQPSETLSSKLTEAADAISSLRASLTRAEAEREELLRAAMPFVRMARHFSPEGIAESRENPSIIDLCSLEISDDEPHEDVQPHHYADIAAVAVRLSRADGEKK